MQDSLPEILADTLPDTISTVGLDSILLDTANHNVLDSGFVTNDTTAVDTLPVNEGGLDAQIKSKAADKITYFLKDKYTVLEGDASIDYLSVNLQGDYIRIDNETSVIFAKGQYDSLGNYYGRPKLVQDGQEITADSLKYNFDTKRAFAWNGLTAEGEGFIRGGKMKLNEEKVGFIKDGIYTTCDNPNHPHYGIRLYKTKVTKNKIITGPANLFIEGVQLPIGIPFGFFPKTETRASGIIIPTFREDASLGFSAENFGYYLGLNDHFDLALMGQIHSLGSYGVSARSNYSWRYRFNGGFSADYISRKLPNDQAGGFSVGKQFNVRWNHSQASRGTGSNFSASVNAGTSKYYQNTTQVQGGDIFKQRARNTLSSSVNYSKTWAGTPFSFSSSANHNQEVSTGQVSIGLPTMSFNIARITPFDSKNRVGAQKWYHRIGLSYSLNADNRVSTFDSLLFKPQTLDRLQTGIRHSIPISTSIKLLKFISISPSFNYNERWYFKTFRKRYDPITQRVVSDTVKGFEAGRDYSMSIGVNTRLYGKINFKKGKIQAIRHVITPSIGFSYRPDFGDPKYGYYKTYLDANGKEVEYSIFDGTLYGGPSKGLSKSMFFSLDNIIEMKVRTKNDTLDEKKDGLKKVKILDRLSISGGYNFAADSFQLSTINFSGSTSLIKDISINFNGTFDPYAIKNGRRVPELQYNQNGKFARLTNFSLSFRGSLNSNKNGEAENGVRQFSPGIQDELYTIDPNPAAFIDFTVPWNISFGYSFNYRNSGIGPKRITQALDFNGDFSVTPKWKVGFFSSYDFQQSELGNTRLSVFRDLHCWTLSFDWVPFGPYRSYGVDLRVKSSILSDLKLTKRRNFYDYR